MIWFIFYSIACGLLWGYIQGTVMSYAGVRKHKNFALYHTLLWFWFLFALLIGKNLDATPLIAILGCAFIGWECIELSYFFARFRELLPVFPSEYVFGFIRLYTKDVSRCGTGIEIKVHGSIIYLLHAARIVVGGMLIYFAWR